MNSNHRMNAFFNTKLLLLSFFILCAGISSGIFFTCIIPKSDRLYLMEFLHLCVITGDLEFITLFCSNFLLLALIFISGLTVYGFPGAFIILFFRAIALGTVIPLMDFIKKEDLFALSAFNLLFVIILLTGAWLSCSYALSQLKNERKISVLTYLAIFLPLAVLTFLLALFTCQHF